MSGVTLILRGGDGWYVHKVSHTNKIKTAIFEKMVVGVSIS